MKLFSITDGNEFKEYIKTPFQINYEEKVLEEWLENNPSSILENQKVLVIGRQVTTNLNSVIDLLGIDPKGDLVVIELKRGRTPRETLAQVLEYASYAARLDAGQLEGIFRQYIQDEAMNLAQYHREYFELGAEEAITFNKNQQAVIVGQAITPEIRQTTVYLRRGGFKVTCIEFCLFETEDKRRLFSSEIVVGTADDQPENVSSGALPKINRPAFMDSLDENGKPFFERLLDQAKERNFPIHWGAKGFSLNVPYKGTHVAIGFGFPPESAFKQSLTTGFYRTGGLNMKLEIPPPDLMALGEMARATGLFEPWGKEWKCQVRRNFSDVEMGKLIEFFEEIAGAIKKYPLKAKNK